MARFTNLRSSIVVAAATTAAVLWATVGWCEPIVSEGTQPFDNAGDIFVNGVGNGNINTGTSFTLATLTTDDGGTQYFLNLFPVDSQDFTNVSFDTTSGNLSFSNAQFGSFAATSFTEVSNDPVNGIRSFSFTGTYTQGTVNTNGPLTPNPTVATFALSFNQTPAGVGTVNANGVLNLTPQPVPEPTTLAMAGFGIAALVTRVSRSRSSARRRA